MADLFLHQPEGDSNPYDAVPWSRHPLEPHTGERFRVGVRVAGQCDAVAVEWQAGGDRGYLQLERDDDIWSGELGPFKEGCRYRFVASGSSVAQGLSEWFSVAIARWETVGFSSVDPDGEQIRISGDRGQLTLTPGNVDSMRWTLDMGSGPSTNSRSAEHVGWHVQLDDDGDVILARNEQRLILRVDLASAGGQTTMWRLRWSLDPDELIFGTGERFDAFDQRGKTPDMRVFEQYKRQGPRTYFPVPWLISTQGYGLAIDGATRVQFDLGATRPDEASVTVPRDRASGSWYFGTPRQLLEAYASDIGRPPTMPLWAFGPWMSGNEWDSDRRVREVVDRTRSERIPATVVVIEAWSDEATFYLFNDTEYEPVAGSDPVPVESMSHGGRWPDPTGLVEWLHERGVRVLLWQIPVLKDSDDHEQHARDSAFAKEASLTIRTVGGETYRNRGWWFPASQVIDFTNPEAREWWFAKRSYLLDTIGIDGFKTDGGEHLWGRDVVAFDGSAGDEAANAYPTHYLAAYHEFMRDHGHDHPMTFSRAGFTGSQAFPAHWAGDEDATWEAYRASLTAGLSAGASGVAFWGWDLAGFSGELPSAELYKRATAMAAFCPIMQYHSEHNEHRRPLADRTPWNVADHSGDTNVTVVYRFYARLRMNLVPYLFGLGVQASRTGLPLMRALALEYPDDPQAVATDDQFLLGPDVMVAPVLVPGIEERSVYLPAGDWRDLWTGTPVASGWITARAPSDAIPAFVRGGSCVPLWMPEMTELGAEVGLPEAGSGRLVLLAVPGTGHSALVDPLTGRSWTAELELEAGTLTIVVTDAPGDVTVWLRGANGPDTHVPLPAGDSRFEIELASDGR